MVGKTEVWWFWNIVIVNPIELGPKIKFLFEIVATKYEREWD